MVDRHLADSVASAPANGREARLDVPTWLELLGKSIAVAVVLLPLAGVMVRYVAFAYGAIDTSSAWVLATAFPISLLVVTALFPLLLSVGFFVLIPGLRREDLIAAAVRSTLPRIGRWREDERALQQAAQAVRDDFSYFKAALERGWFTDEETADKELKAVEKRAEELQVQSNQVIKSGRDLMDSAEVQQLTAALNTWYYRVGRRISNTKLGSAIGIVVLAVTIALWGVLVLFTDWPGAGVFFLQTIGAAVIFIRYREPLLHRGIVPIVILIAAVELTSAISAGLSGSLPGVSSAEFRFKPEVAVSIPDGRYTQVGERDNDLFLQSCTGRAVIEVPRDEILSSTWDSPKKSRVRNRPNLWDVVTRRRSTAIGYQPDC